MNKIYTVVLILLFIASGCSPYNQIVNFNASENFPLETHKVANYQPLKLETGDILNIEVSSANPEAVSVFREHRSGGYLIDANGEIDFPLAGQVSLKNKTLEEARATLLQSIQEYFDIQPSLSVSLANFKVTINGEITRPGVVNVQNNRMTIIEAITLAGDFTPYSNRDSILIVREIDQERSFGYINFNSSEIFNSPYFYLKQNDVVYIKPEKRFLGTLRTRQDKLIPYISVAISLVLLTFSISRNR